MAAIRIYYRGEREVDEEYVLKTMTVDVAADGVALVTFSRPKELNSLSWDFKHELMLVYEYLARSHQVRAVVWTGAGRDFSAGADLTGAPLSLEEDIVMGYRRAGKGVWEDDMTESNWRSFVGVALRFPKASIAAVNGFAIGGGTNMAFMFHDHVVAGESTKFRYPFGLMSLIPEFGSTFLLPAQVGMLRAKEMLLLAGWITAKDAHQYGLVNKVVPDADIVAEAMSVAKFFAEKDLDWFRKSKELLHKHILEKLDENLRLENDVFRAHMDSGIPLEATQKYMLALQAEKKAKKAREAKL